MNRNFLEIAREACGADEIFHIEDIQSLWSGYGKIMRYAVKGKGLKVNCFQANHRQTIVVKHVRLPDQNNHPRGWNTNLSHQRKIHSYQIETSWYHDWAKLCDESCRVPLCFDAESDNEEFLMVFEDLDASGFPARKSSVTMQDMQLCLNWLANFHATFLGQSPKGLWSVGTYWHLDTRPDELKALEDPALKNAAALIDQKLSAAKFMTFVHGDAKLANFCFSTDGSKVAAVDFQYVGGGCGMKDVAYFIGSCLYEEDCEQFEKELLDYYFVRLGEAIKSRSLPIETKAVEQEWRSLYPLAWTDFHRFVKGWSPGHWKIHGYSERIAREVVAGLAC